MSRSPAHVAMWMTTLAAIAFTVRTVFVGQVPRDAARETAPLAHLHVSRVDADSLTLAIAIIAEGNLFRPDRAADADVPVPPASPLALGASSRPTLALRGLVGGPPWAVLMEGVPGRQGTAVLRVGDEVSGVTVTSVRRGIVVVRGFDTTWTLALRPAP